MERILDKQPTLVTRRTFLGVVGILGTAAVAAVLSGCGSNGDGH